MDPSLVIPTCIFIASKVEEAAIAAKHLVEQIIKNVGMCVIVEVHSNYSFRFALAL